MHFVIYIVEIQTIIVIIFKQIYIYILQNITLKENSQVFQHSIRDICRHVLSSYGVLYKFISMTLSVMHVRVKNVKCNIMFTFLGFRLSSQAFSNLS